MTHIFVHFLLMGLSHIFVPAFAFEAILEDARAGGEPDALPRWPVHPGPGQGSPLGS